MEIPLFKVFMNENVSKDLTLILTSGSITQGKQVEKFEEELKEMFDYQHILTLNSATSGLTLAVRLLNLKEDEEILSTPLTCFASNASILANNHKIKWVDIDVNTCNIDLDDLEKKITQNTKALLFVHWGGSPLNLNRLEEIKKKTKEKFGFDLQVIEDCAHAFGAMYNNKYIGTHGNICVFSLQAIKHLTAGDGGLIFLPNKKMYERAKLLRWFGIDREKRSGNKDFRLEENIKEYGYKFHMNDINATIGLSNLPFIKDNLECIRHNALYYKQNLKYIDGVTLLNEEEFLKSAYWIFTIKIINKEGFIPFMKKNNIIVSQVHNRNDKNTCLKEFESSLPNLDILEKKIISIPVGWWLTQNDIKNIVRCIKEWCDINIVKIRELENGDMLAFLDLLYQLNNYKEENYDFEKFKNKIDTIKKQGNKILVAEINNIIVGTGKIFIETKFYQSLGHIEDIVVNKNCRNMNIGKKIINELVNYAKSKGCYNVVLNSKNNVLGFYIKCGFNIKGNEMVKYLV